MPDCTPALQCVERTFEHADALVLTSLLRANAIDASLFDENFVRLDWFEILAFGGFRIMVPALQGPEALQLVADYRNGSLQLEPECAMNPQCPRCSGNDTAPDPRPRRLAFAALIVTEMVALFSFLIRRLIYGRFRCLHCRTAWREPRSTPFSRQQQDAEAALSGGSE